MVEKIKTWYRGLPDKKRYVEFLTAILTIPVLLTVILVNVGSLRADQKKEEPKDTPPRTVVINRTTPTSDPKDPTPTVSQCKKEVGPVQILSPDEEEVVTEDPVGIDISYKTGEYCSVVWSYRINGSKWSDFTDKSIYLYNLTPGPKKFELRVKSLASGDEEVLKRTFYYISQEEVTPTSPEASSSASTTQ